MPLLATAGFDNDDPGPEVPSTIRRFDSQPYTVFSEFPYQAFAVKWVVEWADVQHASEYVVRWVVRRFDGTPETIEIIHPASHGGVDDVTFAIAGAPFESFSAPAGVHWVGVYSSGAPVIYPWQPEEAFQRSFVEARVFAILPCDIRTGMESPTEDVPVGEAFEIQSGVIVDTQDATGTVTNLDWTPLEVSPAGVIEVVSGPTPPGIPSNFSLESGDGFVRSYVLRGLAPGTITLSASASGRCPSGEQLSGLQTQRTVRITLDVLDVKVELTPKVIDLELDENATPIPQDVSGTVTITNIYDQPLNDVRLIDLRPRPRENPPPIPPPLPVVAGPFAPGGPVPDPANLGTLAPGQSVVRTYELRAQGESTVDVTAFVSAASPIGTDRITDSGTAKIDIKDDVLFVLDTHVENVFYRLVTPWVLGGNSWRVVGTFENRSKEDTLIVQLTPELIGNAAYGQPIPEGTSAPDADCAVGILRELAPEESVAFRAPVRTAVAGGTRGTITYRPKVWIKGEGGTRTLIHDERATPALLDDRVVVTDGSGQHTVSVDTADAPPTQPLADELIGHFLVGTVDGLTPMAEGIWSLVQFAGEATRKLLSPWEWPETFSQAAHHMGEFISTAWNYLSETDRQQLRQEIRAGLKAAIDAPEAVYDQLMAGFENSITDVTVAWETGDSASVAQFWGGVASQADLAIGFGYGVCKLAAKTSRYARRGITGFKASQAATLEARIAAGVRALKPWDELSFQDVSRLFAVDARSHNAFTKFADRGFVLGVRRRGQRSIGKLRSGRYVVKPYHVKAKNVSDIDVDWLGFPSDKLDEVLLKEPPPWNEVRDRMTSLGQEPDTIAEVRLRWETRAKEWWGKGVDDFGNGGDFSKSERAQWLAHQKDGIPYSEQSIEGLVDNFDKGYAIPADDTRQVFKKFDMEGGTGSDGRATLAAKIDDKYVTGDIDPLYVGRPDGRGFQDLTDEERLEVYRLFRELGLQHPESRTWKNDKVAEYFEEFSIHNPNGEAMAMYLPDGRVVAAYFDYKKSWINPVNWRKFYMYFHGGTTMLSAPNPDIAGLGADLQEDIRLAEQPRAVYVGPGTWALVPPSCPGGRGRGGAGASCAANVTFVSDPDALVLRQSGIGTFEQWTTAEGWQSYVPPNSSLAITPQTLLTAFARAGSTEIEIADLATLGFAPDQHDWFQIGQTIVINPGAENEETATITGFGSLVLSAPLQFHHETGETVAVVGARQTVRPQQHPLAGQSLVLLQKPGKPETRRMHAVSTDGPQLVLGSEADVTGLAASGGRLRLRSSTGDFDHTVTLPASGWKLISKKKPARGLRFAGSGSIATLLLKAGSRLDIRARGADLGFDLATNPGIVHLELSLGDRRFCFEFGGQERFKANKRLLRRKAARPAQCAAS